MKRYKTSNCARVGEQSTSSLGMYVRAVEYSSPCNTEEKISALQSEISFQTGDGAILQNCRHTFGNGVVDFSSNTRLKFTLNRIGKQTSKVVIKVTADSTRSS
jgi:hypothetical protein